MGGEEIKVSSLLGSIEKEVKCRGYEMMIHCLQSYQGQMEEAIEEFHHGTRTFYHESAEYIPHWQGESRKAYESVYGDLRQFEAHIYAVAEISREITQIHRKIEELQ